MGRTSKELNKQKSKTNFVKGKKEFASNRALLSIPIIATLDKTIDSMLEIKSNWNV